MRRRDFFRTLATAAAGFAILPSAGTYARTWKRAASGILVPNPDYITAPYEILVVEGYPVVHNRKFEPPPDWNRVKDAFPIRFKSYDDFSKREIINPFIFKSRA